MLRTHKNKLAMAVLGVFLAMSPAEAATITYTAGLPIAESTTDINETMSLSLFNLPGVLTGAVLEIFGSGTQSVSLTNNSVNAQTARATQSISLMFGSNLVAVASYLVDELTLESIIPLLSYAPGQTRTFGPVVDSDTISYDMVAALGSLSGPGTFDVTCQSLAGLNLVGGGGNLSSTQTTLAGCGARITYTYDAVPPTGDVPEPSTWMMAGLGAAGLAAGRLRRKSS
ncbi:MAG: choice-of-anchor E domain-containing protein [Bryobacterales bacterium]|nr:choice-of-anchor E domain-containing protein [Bryobacterales bacterium]